MHQGLHGPCHEAVIDEDILLDGKSRVETLEIAGPVSDHARPKGQILGTGRCANGIGLDECQRLEGLLDPGGREQAADRKTPDIGEGPHKDIMERSLCSTER